ncbi:hypothetical protein AB3S75_032057 [Citrus x aurantiifolia]
MAIISVWRDNFQQESVQFDKSLHRFNILSIDTEFPGFICSTPRDAPTSVVYNNLKFNVDNTKIIQLGITLSDDKGNIGSTWEFNFSDFDFQKDPYVEESMRLMQRNGMDFAKIRRDGIPQCVFVPRLLEILSKHKNLKWVTFHGLYDLAHITKLFINHPLPQSARAFAVGATKYFESVLDVKVVAKYCDGLMGGNLGLSKLAKILGVERLGEAHNAGSDSFVTAAVFAKMKEKFEFEEKVFDGILYGMDERIMKRSIHVPRKIIPRPRYCRPLIPHQPPTFMTQGFTASSPRPCSFNYCVPVQIQSNMFILM